MPGAMVVKIFDVEHGQCAMLTHHYDGKDGMLAMIDSGCTQDWLPSDYVQKELRRNRIDHLFITNGDQDHMSGLNTLFDAGISVGTLHRNISYTADQFRSIKLRSGSISTDAERYASMIEQYTRPTTTKFSEEMGGIVISKFYNSINEFDDTNNLSLIVFVEFERFVICFPGDLEGPGWRALLKREDFRARLIRTSVLVASHHGRASGFCEEVFEYCRPDCVVISDKSIMHTTQETVPDYRRVVDPGTYVRTTGKTRHVLTTRRDGTITITFEAGGYSVDTELRG